MHISQQPAGTVQAIYTRRAEQGEQLRASGKLKDALLKNSIKELLTVSKAGSAQRPITFHPGLSPDLLSAISSYISVVEHKLCLTCSQIVFFCLPNDEISLQVIVEQALPHAQPGQVLVDMSTVCQSTSLRQVAFLAHTISTNVPVNSACQQFPSQFFRIHSAAGHI